MKRKSLLLLAFHAASVAIAQEPCVFTVVGDLRVEHFESKTYGTSMTVRIWLPSGYSATTNSTRKYPTLYMLDGQTLFDECTAFKGEHELQLDEAVTKLIAERKVPPMIIVGIDSTRRRDYEYAPLQESDHRCEQARSHLPSFFADELIPWVSGRFRLTTNAAETGIGGTSLGAAAALHVSLNRPDLFGLALLQSPSLVLGNGQLLRDTTLLARAPDRIAIGVGSTEFNFPDIKEYFAPFRLTREETEAGIVKMTP